jgi:transcriptional regulator with XRE-family HTH domain
MPFAETLARLRNERGLSQRALADQAGVSVDELRHWEHGYRRPRLDSFMRLAAVLGVSLDELADGDAKQPAKRKRK